MAESPHVVDAPDAARGAVPEAPRPKRSWPRRVARGVGWALLTLVGLVVALLLWLTSPWGEETVRSALVERLGEKVRGSVELEGLELGLGAEVGLRGLVLSDEQGTEVLSLDELTIDLAATELRGDHIPIQSVRLSGLAVRLEQHADGGSNLKELFITSDAPKPDAPSKRRRIEVRSLAIQDVSATVHKPDGTVIAVKNAGLDAALDVIPSDRTFDVDVVRLGLDVAIDKPDGLSLTVSNVASGVRAHLVEGKGTATLHPTRADIEIARASRPVQSLSVSVGQVEVSIGDEGIEGALDKLAAGAVALEQLRIEGRVVDGALEGQQEVELAGLHIDAADLNDLLGKDVLASDVDVGLELSGPPGALVLVTTVRTEGGVIRLSGRADVVDPQAPGYELELELTDLSTTELLGAALERVPPVRSESIIVTVNGKGRDKETMSANVSLRIGPTEVDKVRIDRFVVDAKLDHGQIEVTKGAIEALGQKIGLEGRYALASKNAHAELALSGDVGEALQHLREAGVPVKTQLPRGAVVLRDGDLTIVADGDVGGALSVDVDANRIAVLGGTVALDVHADLERNPPDLPDKKIALRKIDGTVRLAGVSLDRALALRGKSLPDLSATAGGTISVEGTLEDPRVAADLQVRAHRTDALDPGQTRQDIGLDVVARIARSRADVDLTLSRHGGGAISTLLEADAQLPLSLGEDHKGLAYGGPLRVDVNMADRDVAEIVALLPRRLTEGKDIPPARIGMDVHIEGTPAAPVGTAAVRAEASVLGGKTQRVSVTAELERGQGGHTVIDARVDGWIDDSRPRALAITGEVDLSRSPLLPGHKDLAWKAEVELTPQRISELPITSDKLAGVDGTIEAKLELAGTRTDVLGNVHVALADANQGSVGPLALEIDAVVGESETTLDASAALDGKDALLVRGKIGVPGRGLVAFAKAKQLPGAPLDLAITIPRRPVGLLGMVHPKLEGLPGELSGQIDVGGIVRLPLAHGGIYYDEFDTVSGERGRVAIGVDVTESEVRASVELGPTNEAEGASGHVPVELAALISRPELDHYRAEPEAELTVTGLARAHAVDLRRLVPKAAIDGRDLTFEGQLDWNMDARVVLEKTPDHKGLKEGTVIGALAVSRAKVGLPGTKREYEDIDLRIATDADAVRIERLSLHESDLEKKRRSFDLSGKLDWHDLRPSDVSLRLAARDWLVFGGTLGETDAPRGSLSLDARVDGRLDLPVKKIALTVEDLELLVPDRFERAHQPEETSLGDVYWMNGDAPRVGKLPAPEAVLAAAAPPTPAEPATDPGAQQPETGTDLTVTLPARAHILQSPMDLYATGGLVVQVRPSGREINGKIKMVGGSLSLGGQDHPLRRGHIAFDRECPKGCMDLLFAKKLPEVTMRDVSLASAGDAITIHMTGPLSDRTTVLGGAASPGTLFDLLSVHNAGRPLHVTEPDLPASMNAQFPQHDNLLLLSYLGVNLPHLLFMDRTAAWSDPYEEPGGYGRIDHAELEAYNEERDRRVRVVTRPPEAGQSQSEVQVDWLLSEPGARSQYGFGVDGGSRLGGGPGMFWEWSSED